MSFAFVFSGQGSQYVGMGVGVVDSHALWKPHWEEVDDALGFGLSQLIQEGPEEKLTLTEYAQPAILAYSILLLRVLQAERPDVVVTIAAGHSLGEYSALVAAESLAFADALRLVRTRGQAMQDAVAPGVGGMLAVIGLSESVLEDLCAEVGGGMVELAALNSPVQSVVAGPVDLLDVFSEKASHAGARRCQALKVSAPFHTQMLKPAGERLREALAEVTIHPPRFPVVQNVDGQAVNDPNLIRDKLVEQVSRAVRWVDCVETIKSMGCDRFVEFGPGRALNGLIKKCDRSLKTSFTDRSAFLEQF